MTSHLPLLSGLLRRWGAGGAYASAQVPQRFLAYGRPRPPATNFPGAESMDAAQPGSSAGHRAAARLQRSPSAAEAQQTVARGRPAPPPASRRVYAKLQDGHKPEAGRSRGTSGHQPATDQRPDTGQHNGDKPWRPADFPSETEDSKDTPNRGFSVHRLGGDMWLRKATHPSGPIVEMQTSPHPLSPAARETVGHPGSIGYQYQHTDKKLPVVLRKSGRHQSRHAARSTSHQQGGNMRLHRAASQTEAIDKKQTSPHPLSPASKAANVHPGSIRYQYRRTDKKLPVVSKTDGRVPVRASNEPPAQGMAVKPTAATGPPPPPGGSLASPAGIPGNDTLPLKQQADRPAWKAAAQREALVSSDLSDHARVVVSPSASTGWPLSSIGRQLFFKRRATQPRGFPESRGWSLNRQASKPASGPVISGSPQAAATALNAKTEASTLPSQTALASSRATLRPESPVSYQPGVFQGSETQLIWRQRSDEASPDRPYTVTSITDPRGFAVSNPEPGGDRTLFRTTARVSTGSIREIPALDQQIERTRSPENTESGVAAGIDIPKIAQQVSRLISRQLLVGLERRGIGRWL